MKIATPFVVACVLFSAGCSGDSQADYVGVWQSSDKAPKTFEIRKEGENYVFQDLRATNFGGGRQGPMALSKQGSQLAVNNGLTDIPMGLSADKNTLIVAGLSLTRVPKTDGQRVKQDIETEYTQRIADSAKCDLLRNEMKEKEKAINESKSTASEKTREMKALTADGTTRAKQIPGCNGALLLY